MVQTYRAKLSVWVQLPIGEELCGKARHEITTDFIRGIVAQRTKEAFDMFWEVDITLTLIDVEAVERIA